jgi:hypothetical protein
MMLVGWFSESLKDDFLSLRIGKLLKTDKSGFY